jgi:proteasome assembly chaperone (PAC2) family protein
MTPIKKRRSPKLVNPCLVAAWPGVGNVALVAATYLKDKLKAKELGSLDPLGFFDLNGVFIKDNLVEMPEFPQSIFYYWKSKSKADDMIIFLSEAQPTLGAYQYVSRVLDVAESFGVSRVYTIAAALIEHHPDEPRVLGAATTSELLEELKRHNVVPAGDFYVAGLNGLLLGVAKERDMEGVCLLGETVKYAAKMANPRSSYAVLGVLTKLLQVQIDLTELDELAINTEQQIKRLGDEIRTEYLQNFTRPIWERKEWEEGN